MVFTNSIWIWFHGILQLQISCSSPFVQGFLVCFFYQEINASNEELTSQDLCLKPYFSLFFLVVLPLYAHFKWVYTRISGDIFSKRIRQPIQDIAIHMATHYTSITKTEHPTKAPNDGLPMVRICLNALQSFRNNHLVRLVRATVKNGWFWINK